MTAVVKSRWTQCGSSVGRPGDSSARTEKREAGMVIDYAADGRPIGIEFTSLSGGLKLGAINEILDAAHESPVTPEDLAPLAVA